MSALTDALERILHWLKIHCPELADSFQPGISPTEICVGESKLGFQLPQEVYELYMWRNGTQKDETSLRSLVSPNPCFLPFNDAISSSVSYNQFSNGLLSHSPPGAVGSKRMLEEAPVFIFAIENGEGICIALRGSEEIEKHSVVFLGEGGTDCYFDNLTAMMQTLAEGYETGAYYFDSQSFLVEDSQKVAVVLSRYNPIFYHNLLRNLRSLQLEPNDLETILDKSVQTSLIETQRFQTPEAVELLLDAFQFLREKTGGYRDTACYYIVLTLTRIEVEDDERILEALILASRDSCSFVRETACRALPL